ncbi:hypothetical protein MTR67_040098 [Solanum verrucosum]|uniref:Uncharacterized protein n=1 Tax=Solanum verrucosum TaxID=315347 RepID=A0AAF0ZR32_SOLVR|nr:hypothetical protein MTR67_040098 [Solanum verrucosum]
MVADAFSRLSMASVVHVEDGKKDLVCDAHRLAWLGVHLDECNEGGMIVQNGSKSSLVSNVKAKQDLDPIMVYLKKLVSKNDIEAFSQWGDGAL